MKQTLFEKTNIKQPQEGDDQTQNKSLLLHGDCLELLSTIPDGTIDLIITDPPYTTPTITAFGRKKDKNYADFSIQESFIRCLKFEFERILKCAAPIFMFCDDKYYPQIFKVFYTWHSTQMLIWDKKRIGMGKPFRKRHELIFYANRKTMEYNRTNGITHYPTILECPPVVKNKLHGAQKPVELIEQLILGFSKEGGTVLDCFMGSGTTGVACKNHNRNFIGIELNEKYYQISKERIEACQQNNICDFGIG
jgi:site-specific DNA-methyltransferase (adenine-specific)